MKSKVFEMQRAAILRAMGDKVLKAQRDRAMLVRCLAIQVSKGDYKERSTRARIEATDKEIVRLQAETDKALADVERAAAKVAGSEGARRARDVFAVECIEAGIDDFTAQVA